MSMTEPMTDKQLQQIRERAEKATKGPWQAFAQDDIAGASVYDRYWLLLTGTYYPNNTTPYFPDAPHEHIDTDANMAFIAAARDDIPALMAEVERLRAQNAAMREVVVQVAEMEARQSEGWQQVGLFHESVNVLHVREQARVILAESEGSTDAE